MVTLRADFAPGAFFVLRSDFFAFGLVVFRGVFGFVFFAMASSYRRSTSGKREAYRRAAKKFAARGTDSRGVRLTGQSRLATISG